MLFYELPLQGTFEHKLTSLPRRNDDGAGKNAVYSSLFMIAIIIVIERLWDQCIVVVYSSLFNIMISNFAPSPTGTVRRERATPGSRARENTVLCRERIRNNETTASTPRMYSGRRLQ